MIILLAWLCFIACLFVALHVCKYWRSRFRFTRTADIACPRVKILLTHDWDGSVIFNLQVPCSTNRSWVILTYTCRQSSSFFRHKETRNTVFDFANYLKGGSITGFLRITIDWLASALCLKPNKVNEQRNSVKRQTSFTVELWSFVIVSVWVHVFFVSLFIVSLFNQA